jgi:hypothetical protein
MTNNNNHQSVQRVFSRQPHTTIVQQFPTSGLVHANRRTNGVRSARQTRIIPLNAGGVSRDLARLPDAPAGDWPGHPTRTDHRGISNIRNRPDSVPTHTRPSELNVGRDTHQRQAVTLLQFGSTIRARPAQTSGAPAPGTILIHPEAPAGERP